jgi:single-strand DNA-binding protein
VGWSQTIIIGNVGRDPEFRYTPQGVAVCDFSVAVSRVTGREENRQEKTTWYRVTVWRERAETASRYVKKGMKIMVVGEVEARAYTDKNNQPQASLELTARDFQFLDSRAEAGGGEAEYQVNRKAASSASGGDYPEDTSDIPF